MSRRIPVAFLNSGMAQRPADWHGDPGFVMVVNNHDWHAVANARWVVYQNATVLYDSGEFSVAPFNQSVFTQLGTGFENHTSAEFTGTCNGVDISQSFGSLAQYVIEVPWTGDNDYGMIPAMTSHTSPSGVASASSEWNGGVYPAWWAFDHNLAHSVFECWSNLNDYVTPNWLQYYFGTPVAPVVRYRIYPYPGDSYGPAAYGRNPKAFNLQGSHDGSSWTNLDSQSGHTDWANGGAAKMFTFSNTVAFRYYRLNMTEDNGGTNYQISQLQLFST